MPPRRPDAPRLITGLQPVREAIRAHGSALGGVCIDARPLPRLDALERFARDHGVAAVERLGRGELDRLSHGATHQGVVAWAPELVLHDLEDLLGRGDLIALALDEIQDPQNFGAAIRSAVGLAGAPVLWGEHASAPLTPATFRASAGAIEHPTRCRARARARARQRAADSAVQVVGLDAQAPRALRELDLGLPTVIVIGSEHTGLRRATRRACTVHAKLADMSDIDSLNASAAAAIALYEVAVQRRSGARASRSIPAG